jgi:hypothetical protein
VRGTLVEPVIVADTAEARTGTGQQAESLAWRTRKAGRNKEQDERTEQEEVSHGLGFQPEPVPFVRTCAEYVNLSSHTGKVPKTG